MRSWLLRRNRLGVVAAAACVCAVGFAGYQAVSNGDDAPQPVVVPPASPASAAAAASTAPVEHDGIFPVSVVHEHAGKLTKLKLTGKGLRKAMLLKIYQIASYCDESVSPACVDTLAAADVPKQLCLTMERDIPPSILARGFKEAFEKNDPEQKFTAESKVMLDHMLQAPLKEGESVWITHLPQQGISVRVRNDAPIYVNNPAFAHMVWNVYMGPKGVCPTVRKGLGTRLASATN